MRDTRSWRSCALLTAVIVGISGLMDSAEARRRTQPPPPPPACSAPQPKYVLFLNDYPTGSFYLAELPCLSDGSVSLVSPRRITLGLSRTEARRFQVANGDVFFDGTERRIVFGGRRSSNDYWGIFAGVLDVSNGVINQIREVASTPYVREEDPRFSSDGQWIVYKSDGEIWRTYALDVNAVPSLYYRESGCELWAPSMYANVVSYVRRCNDDPDSDRVVYHPEGSARDILPSDGGGPDRFAHFTRTGELVYSHVDAASNTASLWTYSQGARSFLNQETESDDDAYAERNGDEYISFSGWSNDRYDLYVYRRTLRDAVQLTSGINVLGSILFD